MLEYISFTNHTWVYWTLLTAYAISVISVVGVVLSENRNPLKSLAWITVLLLLPIGGLVLYIFFGRNIKNKHMISRRNRRKLLHSEAQQYANRRVTDGSPEKRQQIDLGRSLTGAVYYPGNDVSAFHYGSEKLEALLADIASATTYIHLQYYIFEDDATGRRLADALIESAARGVRVRVIYDDIGSMRTHRRFFKRLQASGIEVYPFFRVAFPPFATRINWRNHRKICVIDGRVGYIGGMNIADRYIDGGKRFAEWRDTHLRIVGPAVAALEYSFAVDWSFMGQPLIAEGIDTTEMDSGTAAGMQLLTSGPTSEWSNIALQMLKQIGNAKKRIYIQTPYFLPTESLLRALQAAALSRVDVRVMIPRKSDSLILTYASFSYIQECLRAGIKIYLFGGGMLHSKVMIVDDDMSSVGSANIDFRSFEHNFEATMFVYSRKLNAELRRQFVIDEKQSERVRWSQWRVRPMPQKAFESIVRLLSPVL